MINPNRAWVESLSDSNPSKAQWLLELTKTWKCVLCGSRLEFEEEIIAGGFCCSICGQSTLRPYPEVIFPKPEKEQTTP